MSPIIRHQSTLDLWINLRCDAVLKRVDVPGTDPLPEDLVDAAARLRKPRSCGERLEWAPDLEALEKHFQLELPKTPRDIDF